MPTFIRKTVIALLLLLVLAAGLTVARRSSVRAGLKGALTLDGGVTTLALGDSHAQCSVDDRALPWLRNFGNSAESSVISSWKLRHILGRNPGQVEAVIFFVGPHSITSFLEHRWHSQPFAEAKLITQNNAWLLPPEARRTFALTWTKRLYVWLRYDIGLPLGVYASLPCDLGGFNDRYSGKAAAPPPSSGQPSNPASSALSADYSLLFANHIRRFVQEATDGGASVYLINSPIRVVADRERSAPDPGDPFHSLIGELCRDSKVSFHDFRDYPLPADCFRDKNHLNPKGAAIFTQRLVQLIGEPQLREGPPERTVAASQIPGPRACAVGAAALLCCCLLPFMRRRVTAPSQAPIQELADS
jgi:hypothetical protein